MRFSPCLIFLGVLAASAVFAQPEPHLVLQAHVACLLGYNAAAPQTPRIDCWQPQTEEPERPDDEYADKPKTAPFPIQSPDAIVAAGSTDICALKNGVVRCFHWDIEDPSDGLNWKWKEAPKMFERSGGWTRIWGSSGVSPEVCAQKLDGTLRCTGDIEWGMPIQSEHSDSPSAGFAPYDKTYAERPSAAIPGALALDELLACAIHDDRSVACWTARPDSAPHAACAHALNTGAPKNLAHPGGLFLSISNDHRDADLDDCRACVQDTDHLVCWGQTRSVYNKPVQVYERRFAVPGLRLSSGTGGGALFPIEEPEGGFIDLRTLAHQDRASVACVQHDGHIYCAKAESANELTDVTHELFPRQTAGVLHAAFYDRENDSYCGVDATQLVCERSRHAHGQALNNFGIASIERSLQALAAHSYRASAAFYEAAAKGLQTDPDRLFALNAIAPLVESTNSEYFDATVKPAFREMRQVYNARYAIDGLRSIPGGHAPTALRLLHVALEGLRGDLPAPALALVQEKLGAALASGAPSERAAFVSAYRTLAPSVALAAAHAVRAQGLALTAQALFAHLEVAATH